ncbi:MAG: hypothetical protein GQ525_14175, partial [Draconibacterium sp.]|nr:hypothetical protein [Draconibacterium sp.]
TQLTSTLVRPKNTSPTKIIFDTDMDSDVDDVGALAMLHAMMTNGEVEILAVMVSSTCPGSAACIDAINTYYGRPDLPIGVKKGSGVNRDAGFVGKVANKFPQDIGSSANAADAKVLYRQILAGLPNKSVKILTVGYLSNLEDLLKTSGDSISSLNGNDLVELKVNEYVCMGGKYPNDLSYQGNGNFEPDGKAVKYVNKHWPTMLTFSAGGRYQWDIKTGAPLLDEDMNVNPVAFAYQEFYELVSWDSNYPDHHSADPIGVYVAVKGFKNQFTVTTTLGYFYIWDNGLCEWRTDSDNLLRRISYTLKDPYLDSANKLANEIETLMLQVP